VKRHALACPNGPGLVMRSYKSLRTHDVVTWVVRFKGTGGLTVHCGFYCTASRRHGLTVERPSRTVISGVSFG